MQAMADRSGKHARDKIAAIENPLRLAIVSSLTMSATTAVELANQLDVPVEKVRYHLRWLRDADLVEVKEKARRGGITENVYSIDPRKYLIRHGDRVNVSSGRLDLVHARLLRLMFREAMEAARAGTFSERPQQALLRFLLPLDEQGWEEAIAIHERVINEVLEVRAESQARLDAGDEQEILARLATLLFESRGTQRA
ncbi:MAG TPA: winged helix-turn-helix domain-containing protein [Solirubrobacterales bacterium]|nr:winged helix-turn-helix domain-containing protein [Solirubrobacterales bacterium]